MKSKLLAVALVAVGAVSVLAGDPDAQRKEINPRTPTVVNPNPPEAQRKEDPFAQRKEIERRSPIQVLIDWAGSVFIDPEAQRKEINPR